MEASMFVLPDSGELVEMRSEVYLTEADLQDLLARFPELIRGAATGEPRHWLLVRQEASLPDDEGAGDRWAMDHLFLDQEAIPTLVEVKRSTDTRIRREVVGQMLDYAANAVVYLPAERIRSWYEERCATEGLDPDETVGAMTGPDISADEYWASVETNLKTGRVRLIFVADAIPRELARIVEFLNGQMDPAEVLAVEVPQFVGDGLRTLVPRVIGRTAEAERSKGARTGGRRQWDEESFFADLLARRSEADAEVAHALLAWGRTRMPRIAWGTAALSGTFFPMLDHADLEHDVIAVNSRGYVTLQFGYMASRAPFDTVELRSELHERLVDAGFRFADTGENYPNLPLATFADAEDRARFLTVLDWAVDRISAHATQPS